MHKNVKRTLVLMSALALSLTGCQNKPASPSTDAGDNSQSTISDGTYTAVGKGNNGDVSVSVTFTNGKITDVTIGEHGETAGICETAFERVPAAIVEGNTVNVDTVTGATHSSEAVIEAVKKTIEEAGGKVDDFNTAAEKQDAKTETAKTQIVVVGAGASGVSAALQAAQNGAEVILLEKSANPGGVSVLAGGIFAMDSDLAKAAGVAGTFTFEEILTDWQSYNCWMSDSTMFYNILGNSGETSNWLMANGVDLTFVGNEQVAHAENRPTYEAYGSNQNDIKASYFKNMVANFEKAGGTVYYETPAVELVSKDDTITGVIAKKADGTRLEITCDSVVLATGGFGASTETIENYVGFPLYTVSTGTQTGDGLNMALAIGAGEGNYINELHGVTSYVDSQPGLGTDTIGQTIYFPGSVWINQDGYRFAPETINFDTALAGNAAFAQGEYFYSIISEDMVKTLETKGTSAYKIDTAPGYIPGIDLYSTKEPWTGYQKALDDAIAEGKVYKADTLGELAKAIGVNEASLTRTFSTYNASCNTKTDEVLGKDSTYLINMEAGPYYAVKGRPVSLGAIGGLALNSDLQVLKEDGSVIKGLYAAGNEIGEIYNNSYPLIEGVSLGVAFNSGRLAGNEASSYVTSLK